MPDKKWIWGLTSWIEITGDVLSYRQLLVTGQVPVASVTSVTYTSSFLHFHVLVHVKDADPLEFPMTDKKVGKKIAAELKEAIDSMQSGGGARGASSVADELRKLAQLRDDGILTEDEFQKQKKKLLV